MNKQFWVNKKVFITGHTGFKGSWLTIWLKMLGASITGYSLPPPSTASLYKVANVEDHIDSTYADILDMNQLLKSVQNAQPEIVFHLAAQPLVHYSYENPLETFSVNVMGTANLLETIRSVKSVRAVVVVTSDKCYENNEWVWGYRETDAMGGFDPYSSSKGCTELVTSSYRRSFFHPDKYHQHQVAIASARAGNVIGGGDWSEGRLIPDLVKAFVKNEVTLIRNPSACRPWQYVLDVLNGYLMLAQQLYEKGPVFADAWNFGPSDENVKSVAWIANQCTELWGNNVKWTKEASTPLLHEANCLKLESNKARSLLGWSAKMTLESVLTYTLEWYQAYFSKADMKKITEEQINKYIPYGGRSCPSRQHAVFVTPP